MRKHTQPMKTFVRMIGIMALAVSITSINAAEVGQSKQRATSAATTKAKQRQAFANDCDECVQIVQSNCANCHGENGIGIDGAFPNLAGQKQAYLAKQLKDFREKNRANDIMGPIAEPLSDAHIAGLATYFSSLPAAK